MSDEIEVDEKMPEHQVNDNDKTMALLAYAIPYFVSLVILLSESSKDRPFQRYHAINSILVNSALLLLNLVFSCTIGLVIALITVGIGSLCLIPFWFIAYFISLYYGIQAYQGRWSDIPVVTNFAKGQGWL